MCLTYYTYASGIYSLSMLVFQECVILLCCLKNVLSAENLPGDAEVEPVSREVVTCFSLISTDNHAIDNRYFLYTTFLYGFMMLHNMELLNNAMLLYIYSAVFFVHVIDFEVTNNKKGIYLYDLHLS